MAATGLESNILLLQYSNASGTFEAAVAEAVDVDGSLYMSLLDTPWKTQRRGDEIVFQFNPQDWDAFTEWCSGHTLSVIKVNEAEWQLHGRLGAAPQPGRSRSVCSETERNGNDSHLDCAKDKLRAGQSFFVTGEGGSGKSYLAWQLYDFALQELRWKPEHIAITAYTGVAAQELLSKKPADVLLARDVSTLHAFMGLTPTVKTVAQLQDLIEKTPDVRARWTSTYLLFIDEISMVDATMFTMLFEMRARFNNRLVVLCLGDFCQLPPRDIQTRDKHTGNTVAVPDFCFACPAWRTLIGRHVITLTTNYRVENDREWRKLLTRVRLGHQTEQDRLLLWRMQPSRERPVTEEHVHIYCRRRQVKEFNATYFGNLIADQRPVQQYKLTWKSVERITNGRGRAPIVTKLPLAEDTQMPADAAAVDFMKKLVGALPGLPDNDVLPTDVTLCVGARVIYERNLLDEGLGNGMQGIVVAIEPDRVQVTFDNRATPVWVQSIEHTELSPAVMWSGQNVQYKVTCTLLPLQLAGAITVHKAQGMTLDKVYIKLFDENVVNGRLQRQCTIDFPGQVYVALSRGRNSANTIVDSTFGPETNPDWLRVKPHPDVVAYYASLTDVQHTPPPPRSRVNWGPMLNQQWLQRGITVNETPLFILYQREKEYNRRLKVESYRAAKRRSDEERRSKAARVE